MEIKIHSLGTKGSLDFRSILENMYRKVGNATWVDFPDEHTVKMLFDGEYEYENEYGIHRMVRATKKNYYPIKSTAHVMVEIDGRTRDEIVASYIFYPTMFAKNNRTGKRAELMSVLDGNPLEMRMKIDERALA